MIYLNSGSGDFKTTVDNLKPCSGICMFIDLCGSTEIKKDGSNKWIYFFANSFNVLQSLLRIRREHIIKFIGDEVMIFIPEPDITADGETLATHYGLLQTLVTTKFKNKIDDITLETKAAIHYCVNVYIITFHEGFNDYYGIDIDLTARLMKKAVTGRIVISEQFFQRANRNSSDFLGVKGPYIEDFKGITGPTEFRIFQ